MRNCDRLARAMYSTRFYEFGRLGVCTDQVNFGLEMHSQADVCIKEMPILSSAWGNYHAENAFCPIHVYICFLESL